MSLNNKLDNIAEPLQFLGQWLLRAPLGVVMIIHGLGKFPPPAEGFANMLAASGIPLPSLTATLVCLGEIGAGAGVIIGGMLGASLGHLVTRLSGGAILVIMVGAYLIRHSDWLWTVQMVDTMQFFLLTLGTYFAIKGNN